MAAIHDLLAQVQDQALRERIEKEIDRLSKTKKFGLVFEEHMPECTPLYDVPVKRGGTVAKRSGSVSDVYEVLEIDGVQARCINRVSQNIEDILIDELVSVAQFGEAVYPYLKPIDSICNAPESNLWHALIEADNYHALQLLEYLYAGKVDCIYIDPPYNTGAKDWKYNNDYVDLSDSYRHSKWLSFMEKRLRLAKKLLNPRDSVLIVTIDEKEYLHLGCLLEEVFSDAKMQMISSAINGKGIARDSEFARVNEYIFVVRIGEASVNALSLPDEWMGNVKTSTTNQVRWGSLMRSGSGALRTDSPGCFYPIYISKDKKHFCGAGEIVPVGVDRNTVSIPDDVIALFPIHDDGVEGRWQYSRDKYLEIQKKGYVRISTQTSKGKEATLRYISEGWQKKVESGQINVLGYDEDGSVLLDDSDYTKEFVPGNQWWIPSHDATEFGSKLLTSIIGKRFSFPKSLYAVEDTLRFFVKNKKNALILDFFAGSGTTLHAVNLLNAED
jgi:adenine-specific DNA-methyltransferase